MFGDKGGIFDGVIPDITCDGKSDFLDAFLLEMMIQDTEDAEAEELKKKQKKQVKVVKKKEKSPRNSK